MKNILTKTDLTNLKNSDWFKKNGVLIDNNPPHERAAFVDRAHVTKTVKEMLDILTSPEKVRKLIIVLSDEAGVMELDGKKLRKYWVLTTPDGFWIDCFPTKKAAQEFLKVLKS